MAYVAWSVVFGEQPTAAKWNILGTNDASFHDGTGIDDDAIVNRHMADDSVTGNNLSLDFVDAVLGSNFATSSTSFVDSGLKLTLPAIGTWLILVNARSLSGSAGQFGTIELYNQTTSTVITDSERLAAYATGSSERMHTAISMRVTTTTINNVLAVYFKSGGAYSVTMESDPNGKSTILALRIG